MTQAQNAAAILRKNGISAPLAKPPVSLGRGSCAFGLMISGTYLPGVLQLLRKTSLNPLGIFENTATGWREVVL